MVLKTACAKIYHNHHFVNHLAEKWRINDITLSKDACRLNCIEVDLFISHLQFYTFAICLYRPANSQCSNSTSSPNEVDPKMVRHFDFWQYELCCRSKIYRFFSTTSHTQAIVKFRSKVQLRSWKQAQYVVTSVRYFPNLPVFRHQSSIANTFTFIGETYYFVLLSSPFSRTKRQQLQSSNKMIHI